MFKYLSQFGAQGCGEEYSILGIPPWHKYLDGNLVDGSCNIVFQELNDFWSVALALLEILLRLSGFVAVAFIIWGSIVLITSGGSPQRIQQGRNAILYAIIGLVIAVSATIFVNFIAGQF